MLDLLFHVPDQGDRVTFYGHAVLLAVLVLYGLRLIWYDMETAQIGASFMHLPNLVFHEAGHIVFIPLGRFMALLGGSLLQLLIPAIVAVAFLFWNRNPMGATVGLWWLGESLMDLAPYIADARAHKLVLLGGITGKRAEGVHDWTNILNYLEIIQYDRQLGRAADLFGSALMLLAMAWAGWLLYKEYRRIDDTFVHVD